MINMVGVVVVKMVYFADSVIYIDLDFLISVNLAAKVNVFE